MNVANGHLLCRRCGWCCQNQLIGVSTVEIRAINEYLKRKSPEDIEGHVVSCLAFEGVLDRYESAYKKRKQRLFRFFDPCETVVIDGTVVVKTHVIHLLQESKRCVFYNPLGADCFIYPARPLTCRMFPYEVREGRFVMVDETDECSGAGFGESLCLARHTRLSEMCVELLSRDDHLFRRFVQEKGRADVDSVACRFPYTSELDRLPLIDPFVELGLISGDSNKEEKEK